MGSAAATAAGGIAPALTQSAACGWTHGTTATRGISEDAESAGEPYQEAQAPAAHEVAEARISSLRSKGAAILLAR